MEMVFRIIRNIQRNAFLHTVNLENRNGVDALCDVNSNQTAQEFVVVVYGRVSAL